MNRATTRRDFLGQTGAVIAAGYFVNPVAAEDSKSPNERLNIAAVGTSGRAGSDIQGVASQNIVAIADIDANFLGQAASRYPGARKYEDFRVMLEKEADRIDAVVVGTPDHSHAPAAAMALRLKKHVYCEKPLTHTVYESRVLAELAAKNQLVTQMGTQIHAGANYRRVVELVQSGAIGEIREVHVWAGAKYSGVKFTSGTPAPAHVNWDLWLGPAMERPYSTGVHPFKWRSFWDYGTGALGDFGCHYMDLAHWALELKHPTRVSAEGPPVEAVSTPTWTIAHYEYPQRGKLPPVKLTWYDSGKQPPLLAKLRDKKGQPVKMGSGQLFVGKEGMILSNYSSHRLFPEEKFADFKPPKQTLPPSVGHHREWVDAIKTGSTTTCNFAYSGALTEAVLLGTVAYRSGETIDWDGKKFKANNAPAAQQLLHKEYRKGWTL